MNTPNQTRKRIEKIQRIRRSASYIDPERKKPKPMTIAAGFCCPDGVVLCADSQFTIPDSMKYADSKIRMGNELKCLPFFAFCGDMDYQKQCSGHFLGALTGAEKTGNSLHKALETTALEMHSTYYDVYSDPDDKLNASMFVSLYQGAKRVLYKIWGPKVTQVERMDCMGSGAYLARALTGTYWEYGNDMIRTTLAATYILSDAKKHVDGCSGDTQVVCLSHDSAWSLFGENTLPRIDPMPMLENRYQVWKQRFGALLMDFQDFRMSHLDFEERLSRLGEHLLQLRKERTDFYDEAEFQEIQAQAQALRDAEETEES